MLLYFEPKPLHAHLIFLDRRPAILFRIRRLGHEHALVAPCLFVLAHATRLFDPKLSATPLPPTSILLQIPHIPFDRDLGWGHAAGELFGRARDGNMTWYLWLFTARVCRCCARCGSYVFEVSFGSASDAIDVLYLVWTFATPSLAI